MNKPERGFSMVEVLIAFTVMSVAILAILGLFPTIFRSDRRTMFSSVALYEAQGKMDQLLQTNVFLPLVPLSDNPQDLPSGFRSWVGSPDPQGDPGTQVVTVTVNWVENGLARSIVLESEVSP